MDLEWGGYFLDNRSAMGICAEAGVKNAERPFLPAVAVVGLVFTKVDSNARSGFALPEPALSGLLLFGSGIQV